MTGGAGAHGDLQGALAARERQVAELRAHLAGLTARAELAEASAALHIDEAVAQSRRAEMAEREAAAQRDRAEAREVELANVLAARERDQQRIAEIEGSRAFRLAASLRRLRTRRPPA